MDKMDQTLRLAERIVTLRAELAAAEGVFREVMQGPARVLPVAPRPTSAPIAQRVRDLLHDGKSALSFGELVDLVGGPSTRMAARSALKKLRAGKQVRFAGGKYSWAK